MAWVGEAAELVGGGVDGATELVVGGGAAELVVGVGIGGTWTELDVLDVD